MPASSSNLMEEICEGESFMVQNQAYTETGEYIITIPTNEGCDSLVYLDLRVHPNVNLTRNEAICAGQTIEVGNESFNETGVYVINLESPFGCDSTITLNLIVEPGLTTTLNESICAGQSFEIGGETFTETGTHTVELVALAGCDSVVTLNLEVVQAIEVDLQESICEGSSFTMGVTDYTETGIYTETFTSSGGCDSTVTLDLTVNPVMTTDLVESFCAGNSIIIGNETFDETGEYSVIVQSHAGCDSTVNLNLTVHPIITTTLEEAICTGQVYEMGGQSYTETGSYTANLQTSSGCDSTVTLNLTVEPGLVTDLNETICEDESYEMGGQTYDETGIYTADLTAAAGCDSTVTLILVVLDEITTELVETICNDNSYTLGTTVYTETGIYTETFTSSGGCDSTVTLDLTVNPVMTTDLVESFCAGNSIRIGDETFTETGDYSVTLSTNMGCDSTVNLNLTVHPIITTTLEEAICTGLVYEMGGQSYTETGSYTANLQTSSGCDSTVTLNLTVEPGLLTNLTETICAGESYEMGGQTYEETGIYSADLTALAGCDSTVTLNLEVVQAIEVGLQESICQGSSFTMGVTDYTETGIYTETFTSSGGCDSTVTLDLTVNPVLTTDLVESFCAGNSITIGTETYDETGEYSVTLPTNAGCDSTVNLSLTVHPTVTTTLEEAICTGQVYEMGGQSYTETGSYTANLQTSSGCDSTVTFNLTVEPGLLTNLTETICAGESYEMGGQTYEETGIYSADLTALAGCDSTVTLNLEVVQAIEVDLQESICEGSSFTMGVTDYTETGIYTETFTSSGGCDSTVTLDLTVNPVLTTDLVESFCAGNSITIGTETYDETGEYSVTLPTNAGCDSTVNLSLTVHPTVTTTLEEAICTGQVYEMGGQSYTETGSYTANLQTSSGCDSTVTLNLTVELGLVTNLTETICAGESYEMGGQTYEETGIYSADLTALAGCDSTVTLNLEVVQAIEVGLQESICEGSSFTMGVTDYTETGIYTETFTSSGGCDSTVTLDLTVNPVLTTDLVESFCAGNSITIGTETYDETGEYSVTLPTNAGCDSTVNLSLTVHPTVTTTLEEAICTGQVYEMGGQSYTETGSYTANLQTSSGCDSMVTLNLTVEPGLLTNLTETICAGESYEMGGQTYEETGIYSADLTALAGCDSTVTLNLEVVQVIEVGLQESICEGSSFTMGVTDYTETGIYTETFTSSGGCDSTVTLDLTVNPVLTTDLVESFCAGNSIRIGDETFTETGDYSVTLSTNMGCDSTVNLSLTVHPTVTTTLEEAICTGQVYEMGGQSYTETGSYTANLQTSSGCDSTVTLNLTVEPGLLTNLTETICAGESYEMGGQTYEETGIYSADLTALAGCDSTVTLNLEVVQAIEVGLQESICQGSSFTMGVTDYTETGIYTETFTSSGGCDSTVTLDLTVNPVLTTDLVESFCAGNSITIGTETYDETGEYSVTLPTNAGCDSTVNLSLTVHPTVTTTLEEAICTGQVYEMGGQSYTETGSYTANLQTSSGCDSTVTLNLTVEPGLVTNLTETICAGESYEMGGQTYEETGIYSADLTALAGCDSTVTLNLEVVQAIEVDLQESICEGSSFTMGVTDYTETGIYTETFTSSGGCDSIVTLDLTVNPVMTTDLVESFCAGNSITIGTETYDETGEYSVTLPTNVGCDSTVNLSLTVHPTVTTTLEEAICTGQVYEMGGQSYTETGSYTANLQTSSGCDSTVTLNLTVEPGLVTDLTETICAGESYEMGGQTYEETGIYSADLTALAGCDSTVTLNLEVVQAIEVDLQESICEGSSFTMGVTDYTETGIYTETFTSSGGCDSIVTLDLTVNPVLTTDLVESFCAGNSITIGTETYDETGEYSVTLPTNAGCDSTVNLSLTVHPTVTTTLEEAICTGQVYEMGGQSYTETGSYTANLQTSSGCDSTVTLNLTVEPGLLTNLTETICAGESYEMGGQTYEETGIYSADLTALAGCDSTVTLNLEVVQAIEVGLQESICEGSSFTMGVTDYTETGIYTETFTSSGGCDSTVTLDLSIIPSVTTNLIEEICEGENLIIGTEIFANTGNYSVVLTTQLGCDSIVNLDLTVFLQPEIIAENETICIGGEVQLEVITDSGNPITWTPSIGLSCTNCPSPIAFPDFTTNYTVSTTGCNGSVIATALTVFVEEPPILTLSETEFFIGPGQPVVVTAISDNPNVTINWSDENGNLLCENCPELSINPESSAIFTATAYTSAGCEASASINVSVIDNCNDRVIEIPNFISPNNDGLNDKFEIRYEGFFTIELLRIFNRWGEQVYETRDISQFWDGKYKGQALNSGVFLYYLEGKCLNGEKFIEKGNITLVQ